MYLYLLEGIVLLLLAELVVEKVFDDSGVWITAAERSTTLSKVYFCSRGKTWLCYGADKI